VVWQKHRQCYNKSATQCQSTQTPGSIDPVNATARLATNIITADAHKVDFEGIHHREAAIQTPNFHRHLDR
jgi:hypothetical protein